MRVIDRLYLRRPFYGVPRMTDWLRELGFGVNRKRVALERVRKKRGRVLNFDILRKRRR
jgi:HTH-like domain